MSDLGEGTLPQLLLASARCKKGYPVHDLYMRFDCHIRLNAILEALKKYWKTPSHGSVTSFAL